MQVTCAMRVPFLCREKAAYIKIRRQGVSLNQIAKAFGRSTSAVFRITKRAEDRETLRGFDLRKLPDHIRKRTASYKWGTLMKLLKVWEQWIAGEGEQPP